MSVTAETALKLGASFQTSPGFWLNAQKAVDLYEARSHLRRLPKPLPSQEEGRRRRHEARAEPRRRTPAYLAIFQIATLLACPAVVQ